jgi:hypothetical protein
LKVDFPDGKLSLRSISWKYTYFIWITVQLPIIILADGSYSFVSQEKHRTLDLGDVIPQTVQNKNQLYLLVKSLEKINKSLLPENNVSPVFNTIDGEPGVFVETMPKNSCVYEKCVRSTKCSFLIQDGTCCKECLQVEHYLRTLKSRSQKSNQNNHSKHT